jgi:glycosyltransferase involved in cell wall biosynthesis
MPKLTCITTVFDDGPLLFSAVSSVLGQSFGDFQFLIVDDGSAPETASLLAGLSDPRLQVIGQANDGLSSARNTALRHATGDYICFLDADDSRPDWSFAAIAAQLDRDEPDVLFCPGVVLTHRDTPTAFFDSAIFDRIGAELAEGVLEATDPRAGHIWPLAQLIEPQSANKVVRRALIDRFGLGFPNGHHFEDILFHSQVLAAAQRIGFAGSPSFSYRQHYARPQITAETGLRRFDIIAVARLTLESAAKGRWIDQRLYRSAVLTACLRLTEWCEHSLSHMHKAAFRDMVRGMMRLIDPRYRDFARAELLGLGVPLIGLDYAADLADG